MARIARIAAAEANADLLTAALESPGAVVIGDLDAAAPEALLRVACAIGDPDTGIAEELIGPRIMDVRYDPHKRATLDRPAYFTADHFPLHTDVSYVSNPPRYLLMHCVTPDPGGGGACLIANCSDAASLLEGDAARWLSRPVFRFVYPPGCPVGESQPMAVREPGLWRFKPGAMRCPAEAFDAVREFEDALGAVALTLPLGSGDLLILDNHRWAHGRTAFDPARNEGPQRHFMRTYVAAGKAQTD